MPDPRRRVGGLTRVYRVEHGVTGQGPYAWSGYVTKAGRDTRFDGHDNPRKAALRDALDTADKPNYDRLNARDAGGLDPRTQPFERFDVARGDKVAFTSRANYEAWFTPQQRANLGKLGFKLRVYDVPASKLKRDTIQAAFPGALGHATDEPGHWVTIDAHPVFLADK